MSSRGILVGSIGGSRLYYLPDATDRSQPDGAIVDPSGKSRFINFAQTVSTARGLRRFSTSDFHRFIWGTHQGDDLKLWREVFVNKTQKVPGALLNNLPINENFLPSEKKKKILDGKVSKFKDNQKKKCIPSDFFDGDYFTKSLGRTIKRGAFSSITFDPNALDADGDGFVQDATPFMRPATSAANGLRSAATAERTAINLSAASRKTLSPENIKNSAAKIREALNKGYTRATRRVKVSDYDSVEPSSLIMIRDINPGTNTESSLEFASSDLIEIEDQMHAIGIEIIGRAIADSGFDEFDKVLSQEVSSIDRDITNLMNAQIDAATRIGLPHRFSEDFTDVIIESSYSVDRQPKTPLLKKKHQQIAKIDKQIANSEANAADESTLLELREERDRLAIDYSSSVENQIDNLMKSKMGQTRVQYRQSLMQRIDEVTSRNARSALGEEIFSKLREMGIHFGGQQLPKRKLKTNSPDEVKSLHKDFDQLTARFIPDALIVDMSESMQKPLSLAMGKSAEHAGQWDDDNVEIQTDGSLATTLHEMMHMASSYNDILHTMQQLILMRRTLGSKDQRSRKTPISEALATGWEEPEVDGELSVIKDEFEDAYAGRLYESGARETLTRPMDYLFDEAFSSSQYLDRDLLASFIGALVFASLEAQIRQGL